MGENTLPFYIKDMNLLTNIIQKIERQMLTSFINSIKILISTKPTDTFTLAKLGATIKLSAFLSPIFLALGGWIDENAAYLNLVFGAIAIDWFLGTIKHWIWIKDFHWKSNIKGILVKMLLTITIGFVVEGMNFLTKDYSWFANNLTIILRFTVFMYPAMSIIRSSRVISDGKFPPQKIYDMIDNWTDKIGGPKNIK